MNLYGRFCCTLRHSRCRETQEFLNLPLKVSASGLHKGSLGLIVIFSDNDDGSESDRCVNLTPVMFLVGTLLTGLGAGLFGHATLTASIRLAPKDRIGLALGGRYRRRRLG